MFGGLLKKMLILIAVLVALTVFVLPTYTKYSKEHQQGTPTVTQPAAGGAHAQAPKAVKGK